MSDKPKHYRCCDDFPDCEYARTGKLIRIEAGQEFVCPYSRPNCAERAIAVKPTVFPPWLLGTCAAVAALMLAWMMWPKTPEQPGPKTSGTKTLPGKTVLATPTPTPVPVVAPTPPPEVAARTILRLQAPEAVSSDLLAGLVEAFLRKEGLVGVETKIGATRTRIVRGQRPGASEQEAVEIKSAREQDAFSRLAKGECEFAVSFRPPTAEEEARMAGVVDVNSPACVHVLALDAPAIIVQQGHAVKSLTTAQLEAIWKAQTDNWSGLGGANAPIQLHLLDDASPQSELFPAFLREHLVTRGRIHRHDTPKALTDAVAGAPDAIGVVPMRYVPPASALAIKPSDEAQSLIPSAFSVATEDYTFSRRILLYNASRHGPAVSQFLRFIASTEGQDTVAKLGYADQNLRPRAEKLPDIYKRALPPWIVQGLTGAQRLSVNFRFAKSSSVLDVKAAADIERVAPRFAEQDFRGKQVLLAGFADSRGGDAINIPLSQDRSRSVSSELQKRGVPVAAAIGLGSQLPVAPNTDETGWEKNRRVEIWLLDVSTPPPR